MDRLPPSLRRLRNSADPDFSWCDLSHQVNHNAQDDRPWRSIVSSRLGRNWLARQPRLSAIYYFAQQALEMDQLLLAVPETAVFPWVQRSAALLGVQTLSPPFVGCRDAFSVQTADCVDAVYIRRGGKLETLLKRRLTESNRHDEDLVRVLLTGDSDDVVAQSLMKLGAIGVYRPAITQVQPWVQTPEFVASDQWLSVADMSEADRWLIHSTRSRSGPWPGESESQFIDGLLISPPMRYQPSPLETLKRIVDQRRLIGTHRTSSSPVPVVCFTALTMIQWLARRTYRPHLGRWDAEPYGIAIDRAYASQMGLLPVLYGDTQAFSSLPTEQRWRYQAAGETFDWTAEQEWRAKGIIEFANLPPEAVRVFVATEQDAQSLGTIPWKIVVVK